MITREDFAINLAKNDVEAEQLGLQKGSRSELSISKSFATKLGAEKELNELFFNQKLRAIVDGLDIEDEISELKEEGYYADSEIMVFFRLLKKIYKDHEKKTQNIIERSSK